MDYEIILNNMKLISVISTVLNEENTIKDFLDSMINQSLIPDEIIIVDGGSKDKTYEILKDYENKYSSLMRVYQLKGANIAQGRNFAIKNSKGVIIITVDAGCTYDKNYIKEMAKPLLKYLLENYEKFNIKKEDVINYLKNKNIDLREVENEEDGEFVQGVYFPSYKTNFGKYAGFMLIKPIKKQYKIPSRTSARATAYFKYIWEDIGGYPEKFVTGEDTNFHLEVLKRKYKWVFKDNAKVYWKMPENIKDFYKKFEKYAMGDVLQGNLFKYKRLLIFFVGFWLYIILLISSIIFYPLFFIILISILLIYLLFLGIKYTINTKDLKAIIYIPTLEIIRRISYQIGFIKGLIKLILK